jgi:hypothetical protein
VKFPADVLRGNRNSNAVNPDMLGDPGKPGSDGIAVPPGIGGAGTINIVADQTIVTSTPYPVTVPTTTPDGNPSGSFITISWNPQ